MKSRGEDIVSLSQEVESLRHALAIVERCTPDIQSHTKHQESITSLQSCLQSCQVQMDSVKEALDELVEQDATGQGMRRRIQKQANSFAYVFKRPRLDLLQNRLHRLNSILSLALQGLGV
jgi:hypothetical protein